MMKPSSYDEIIFAHLGIKMGNATTKYGKTMPRDCKTPALHDEGQCTSCAQQFALVGKTKGHLLPTRQMGRRQFRYFRRRGVYAGLVTYYWNYGQQRLFVWQCHRCNSEQGYFTLRQWQGVLRKENDLRADIVQHTLIALIFAGTSLDRM